MILGVGTDIVDVSRIRAAHEKFGQRFLQRILRPREIEYCLSYKDPAPHVAARFAAKEAASKAFGSGIGEHLGWQDLEVCRKETGAPFWLLHNKAQSLLLAKSGRIVHLSMSHTQNHATAVAILES